MSAYSSIKQDLKISGPVEDERRAFFLVEIILILTLCSLQVHAANGPDEEKRTFNIPQQRADLSLTQFAEQADLTLIFRFNSAKEKSTNKLEGRYVVDEAIKILLADTGLIPVFSDQGLLMSVSDEESASKGDQMDIKKKAGFAALVAALFSANANAQSEGVKESEIVLEEIVVKGIRGGLMRASEIKRNASSFVDVIASTELGRFPDENVAESLQRMTGIQINRVRGEGSTVNIRGMPADFSRVQLNGRTLANGSFSYGGGAPGAASRSFDFQVLPSEFISSLEVIKSPTADMQEGGLAGTVNVRTARPLSIDGRRIALSAFGALEGNSGEQSPRASGLYSNSFADGRFGLLLTGAFTERQPETHRMYHEHFSAKNELTSGIDYNGDGLIEDVDFNIPRGTRTEILREDRERVAFGGVLEFQPNDGLNLYVESFFTELEVESESLENLNLLIGTTAIGGDQSVPGVNLDPAGTVISDFDFDPELVGQQFLGNEWITRLAQSGTDVRGNSRTEQRTTDTFSVALGGKYETDFWTVDAELNHSNSEQMADNLNLAQIQRFQVESIIIPGAEIPGIIIHDPESVRMDPNQGIVASLNGPFRVPSDVETNEFRLDLKRQFDNSTITSIKFGVLASERSQFSKSGQILVVLADQFAALTGLQPSTTQVSGWNVAPFTQVVQSGSGRFLSTYSGDIPILTSWIATDTLAVLNAFSKDELLAAGFIIDGKSQWIDVEEEAIAAYAMATFEDRAGVFSGNFGIRIVQTDQKSVGVGPDLNAMRLLADQGGVLEVPAAGDLSVKRSYTEILPSLNLKMELSDALLLRFAASRTMARPTMTQISPSTTVDSFGQVINRNNPNLDPFLSTNLDFGVEYYMGNGGSVTVALFNKDLATVIRPDVSSLFLDVEEFFASTNTTNIATLEFSDNKLVNAKGVNLTGVELGYQRVFDNNLGVQTNYTFIDNSDPNALAAASKHNYNVSGWYESERFAVRLSYTYRDDFVSDPLPGIFGMGLRTQERAALDANVTYNFNDSTSVVFEGINLLEDTDRISTIIGNTPQSYLDTGRRLMLGVRVEFQ